jgi:hypothetical protein
MINSSTMGSSLFALFTRAGGDSMSTRERSYTMTSIVNTLIMPLIPILGLLPSTINRRHEYLTAFAIQMVTYTFADFAGLLAGGYILVKKGNTSTNCKMSKA